MHKKCDIAVTVVFNLDLNSKLESAFQFTKRLLPTARLWDALATLSPSTGLRKATLSAPASASVTTTTSTKRRASDLVQGSTGLPPTKSAQPECLTRPSTGRTARPKACRLRGSTAQVTYWCTMITSSRRLNERDASCQRRLLLQVARRRFVCRSTCPSQVRTKRLSKSVLTDSLH